MDAPRSNSPSRKSRFRSHSGAAYRPVSPSEEPLPEENGGDAPVYAEEQIYAEGAPGEAVPVEDESMPAGFTEDGLSDPDAEGGAPEDSYHADEHPIEDPVPEEDSLPAGLRLTRSTENMHARRRGVAGWIVAVGAVVCLLLGGLGGYFLRSNGTMATQALPGRATAERPGPIIALAPAVLAEVDAAFVANKQGKFTEARHRFDTLANQYPGWVSMRIEAARSAMYEHDFGAAEGILATLQRAGANVDAEFLTGLLQMTTQTYDKSEAAFARAIALDPARADIFYFWGECLRREGKPQDAAVKFRQALSRNQYETTEGLYQLKLWLSEIQSDQETAKNTNARIDADLASGHPSGPGLFAAAAREIKAADFKQASAHIAEAQKVMEPAVFRVILQDPTFLQENFRPELAPFYR